MKNRDNSAGTRSGKKKITLIVRIILIIFVLAILAIYNNKALTVNEISISNSRIPDGFSGFRIVQISDLHNARFGSKNKKLLEKIAECSPDIIAITGDLIDSSHTDEPAALEFVKGAAKIAPVYVVTGNHEVWAGDFDQFKTELINAGADVLEDDHRILERNGDKLLLLGLSDTGLSMGIGSSDDISSTTAKKLEEMSDNRDDFTILLSHRPELFETYVSCKVDLVLSGHAHGGQFRIPFVGGVYAPDQGFLPKYDSGLYTDSETSMIVSRGLGNSVIPLRIFNRPEIILIELNNK